ncbi:MAG: ABC transporter permease subunit [Planctomycetaceae bacterium]
MPVRSDLPKDASGRVRRRVTKASVRAGERLARTCITVGGIGTILAIVLIFAFLLHVVLPLGGSSRISPATATGAGTLGGDGLRAFELDEYGSLGWGVRRDGALALFVLDSGALLEEARPFGAGNLTALAVGGEGRDLCGGFQDGTVRLASARVVSSIVPDDELTEELRQLAPGAARQEERSFYKRLENGELRRQSLSVSAAEPVTFGSPILKVDYVRAGAAEALAVLTADGELRVDYLSRKKNLLTGKERLEKEEARVPYARPRGKGDPRFLLLNAVADSLVVAWDDGHLVRYDLRDRGKPVLAESHDLVPEPGASLTALVPLIGRSTLVAGDSLGRIRGWFSSRAGESAGLRDGSVLVPAQEVPAGTAAVSSLTVSSRGRLFLAGYADGSIRLFHMTTGTQVGEARVESGAVDLLAMGPKEDGFAALAGGALSSWRLAAGHPEATLRSLFRPIWYEEYDGPSHVWQSSSGSDAFEPKFGLWPLIFGTLKATLYAMVCAVPIAFLAAIFTSEFLARRARTTVKSAIEMMASLPSVVLGFLAALVIAPFVQNSLASVLASVYLIPYCFLLGAHLWGFLPPPLAIRLGGWPRIAAIALTVPAAVVLAGLLGPALERGLFGGNLQEWLKAPRFAEAGASHSSAFGGWFFLLLPAGGLGAALLFGKVVGPRVRRLPSAWNPKTTARRNFLFFVAGTLGAMGLAGFLAWGLTGLGMDARGGLLDTYVQRNALIVGFVMGFAIIPIIYTIAEDALSSVPDHLRLGSLGAGATPWQTATRIVIPTAMSGLFSAAMIGLGRAVGETMIVLMATGNTPVLDLNIFNGFRTLSANIATELSEAPKDSTHYRILFLAALVLFAMTFLVNTVAELVRRRFRRKAFEL